MDTTDQGDFYPLMNNIFQARRGPAHEKGAAYCHAKLCFVATDQEVLRKTLLELSLEPDCFFVKYDTNPRDGMYRGRCFFMTPEKIGKTWAFYKGHPKLICSVQDDEFTGSWREQVRNWAKEPVS
jgi:hypothetical protein